MKKNKEILKAVLVLGSVVAVFALVVFVRTYPQILPETVWQQLPGIICLFALLLFSIFPVGAIGALLLYISMSEAGRTLFHRIKNQICAKIATRNSAAIYPRLQYFLYCVISQNNDFLRLPLGKDITCLSPCGHMSVYRKDCVFYRFELICPQKPEMECDTLRTIIQNYIFGELNNYGIAGLAACFPYGDVILPTVFLDRVIYDAVRHCLMFDVLYVCTDAAAKYTKAAMQRNTIPAQPEQEFTVKLSYSLKRAQKHSP